MAKEVSGDRRSPVELFQGFDTFAGTARDTVLTGSSREKDSVQRFDYNFCETIESLYNALSISTEVAADFGFGSVDAKTDYVHSLQTTSTSLVIAIYASNVTGTTEYTSAMLKPGIESPADAKRLNDFYQYHGDSFVSSITKGGEYIATYTFYCQSTEERTSLVASLHAEGIAESGKMTADVKTTIENVEKKEQVQKVFKEALFGFSGLARPGPDHFVEFARDIGLHTPGNHVIDYNTTGYEHVQGMAGQVWDPILDNRLRFTSSLTRGGVNAVAAAILGLQNQIEWLQGIYETYGYAEGIKDLNAKLGTVQGDIDNLTKVIEEIQRDPARSFNVPDLKTLSWGVPVLNFVGPDLPASWGGQGGDEFKDVGRKGILAGQKPKTISLNGDQVVDGFMCVYTHGPTVRHGAFKGGDVPPLELGEGEFVTTLNGGADRYVGELQVITSKKQETRIGKQPYAPFDWQVPDGSVMVGFAGRSTGYLDRIGPLICTFQPTTWDVSST